MLIPQQVKERMIQARFFEGRAFRSNAIQASLWKISWVSWGKSWMMIYHSIMTIFYRCSGTAPPSSRQWQWFFRDAAIFLAKLIGTVIIGLAKHFEFFLLSSLQLLMRLAEQPLNSFCCCCREAAMKFITHHSYDCTPSLLPLDL